jgi:flagellin
MSDITLSSAVRSNLLSLQNTADLLAKTQERLSTGLKVNSALDNPTNFFTASSLNSRAGDLGRLLDGVANATQTLEAADNGIAAITDLVESAQASARQALQARGQQTTSVVTGADSATFNPQSLTTVAGDNTVTGTNAGGITADASAVLASGVVPADADITGIATADLGGAGSSATALDAGTTPLNDGDTITIDVDGTTYTIDFTNDTGTGGNDTGAPVGNALSIDTDATVAEAATAINSLLGADVTVGESNGTLTFAANSNVDVIKFDETVAGSLTRAGLNAVGVNENGAPATERTVTRNSTIDDLVASGGTLQVSTAPNSSSSTFSNVGTAITFGTGVGEVSNRDQLVTALNNLTGIDASATVGNTIELTTSDSTDADTQIRVTGDSNATLETALGYTPDSVTGTTATAQATNLLSQDFSSGDTLSIQVGSGTALDLTFGDATGEISTLAELNSALQSLSGGAASVDANGELNVTADSAGDSITLGGTSTALAELGVTAGEASSLIDGTNIAAGDSISIQIGTNSVTNITFGTGTNQVNTLEELETALGNLAGGTASIDDQTGAITIEATNGSDSITVGATDASAGGGEANILGSFGLTAGTTASVTTDSSTRAELESQFNELLLQIDELAEDAGFNGVNLLDGDDLQVIFNEDGSSALDIEGENFDAAGLGLSRVASGDFQSDANINSTLGTLDTAIQTLRSQASKFGSNLSIVQTREDFTNNMINTLETGAANLTLADTNEEGANLTALQTRQQLSTTSLSFATQADQNVLRLF